MNKRANNCAQNTTSQKAAERLEAAADESDYLDKANDDVYGREEPSYDKVDPPASDGAAETDRLEPEQQKTEESSVDEEPEKETKSLKRKEPAEDETSPKRQCPEIVIE